MKRPGARLLAATLVAAGAGIAFMPSGRADTSVMSPSGEAWYQPNPSCATPAGCVTTGAVPGAPAAAAPRPYPSGTMHVGYAAGREMARSYIAFPLDSVPTTALGAALDVPLDVAAQDGSQSPDTAKIQACVSTSALKPAEGSIDDPPRVSCNPHASLTYIATPTPHLHGDLTPLLSSFPTAAALALLPDATKAGQTDAWRIVFSAHDRTDAAKTPPAVVTLTLADQLSTDVTVAPVTPTDSTLGPGSPVPAAPTRSLPVPQVNPPLTSAPGTGPAPIQAQPAPSTVIASRTITFGYAYPVVWLLPLLFLIVVPLAARTLTRDLTPGRPQP